jgi:hypothetical protein
MIRPARQLPHVAPGSRAGSLVSWLSTRCNDPAHLCPASSGAAFRSIAARAMRPRCSRTWFPRVTHMFVRFKFASAIPRVRVRSSIRSVPARREADVAVPKPAGSRLRNWSTSVRELLLRARAYRISDAHSAPRCAVVGRRPAKAVVNHGVRARVGAAIHAPRDVNLRRRAGQRGSVRLRRDVHAVDPDRQVADR